MMLNQGHIHPELRDRPMGPAFVIYVVMLALALVLISLAIAGGLA